MKCLKQAFETKSYVGFPENPKNTLKLHIDQLYISSAALNRVHPVYTRDRSGDEV